MALGLEPVTRLRTAEFTPGCMNSVSSPAAMEKSFHSIIARALLWFTVSVEPEVEKVAAPEITVSPVGLAATSTTTQCKSIIITIRPEDDEICGLPFECVFSVGFMVVWALFTVG